MNMRSLTRRSLLISFASVASPAIVRANPDASWPSKSIRIVVPYPAGGQTDSIARAFGDFLARELGRPTIIENKGGGGGVIGIMDVKRSDADGHTILCTISSSLIQNRILVRDLPYDPDKDFTYLSMVTGTGGPVVAARRTRATNLREFVDYARSVDSINWGSYGVGSTPHVLIETMAKQYGFRFQVIQYRGEAPMWTDLAGQTLDGAAGSYAAAAPVIQSGTGTLIGVTSERLAPHPEVPTMGEQGALGEFYETRAFTVFAVPANTPASIARRLSAALKKAGSDAKVQNVLNAILLKQPTEMEEAERIYKRDSGVMLNVLRELNFKAAD